MTSELKPIAFLEAYDDERFFHDEISDENLFKSLLLSLENGKLDKAITPLYPPYTRAVPDVPELVRYRPAVYMEPCLGGMFNDEFGEYVLHSQAAEIIAADRATLEQAKKEINTLLVSYVREHFFDNKTFQPLDSLTGMISQLDNAITVTRDFKNRAEAAEAELAALKELERNQ